MSYAWIVPDWPAPPGVSAVCTTREGGVSVGPFHSLNLGANAGDDPAEVASNRTRLARHTGARHVYLNQVHGGELSALKPDTPDGGTADGGWTVYAGVACTVTVADCMPILLTDTSASWVAALHAGWRGLAGASGLGVVEAAARVAAGHPGAKAGLLAWLGPCIGPQAFEVGDEVRAAFVAAAGEAAACFAPHGPGKWLADLPALARQRLRAAGVQHIYGNDGSAPWCTAGNPLRFFSYRRDRVCGRFAAAIWRD